MSFAEIKRYNGQPTIMIDGKPYPPMSMTTAISKPEYLRELGKSGIKIYYLMTNTNWFRPGKKWVDENGVEHEELSGVEHFRREAEILLREIPDAYIIVRVTLDPPVEWAENHPDDLMRYDDGSLVPTIVAGKVYPAMYSLCSENWRRDGAVALREFCDEMDKLPCADRIIGYFLGSGGTSEWYPCNSLEMKDRYADCSPAFKAEYSRYLTQKYKTDEALRKAWKHETATLADPIIPTLEQRKHVNISSKILDALHHYESASRIIGKTLELNPQAEGNIGVFLNADVNPMVADFYYAWNLGTANSIIHFASVIKERYPGKLVGAFYGSYGCTDFYQCSTAAATLPILDSGKLDFLAAPGNYNNREPGGLVCQREMQDSFRLRDSIFVVEEDSRSHLDNDFYRDAMGLYDIQDSLDTLKRDFARDICEDIFAWWFDQIRGGGRYMHPEIYDLFRRQEEIADMAYGFDRTKHNDIALIYDQESLHYVSIDTNTLLLDYYRTTDLPRIGAPVDYYFHDDMGRPDMPDYKMYIVLNGFALTDAEREVIHKKAAKNHAMVVWMYGAGFINPDQDQRVSNDHIQQLTGFRTGRIDDTRSPRFKITSDHEAVKYADPYRRYGHMDRDIHSNVWLSPITPAAYVNPCFYIDDEEAEVLGKYCLDGKAAYAMKEYKGFTSVYCASKILRSELLASLAEYAGCHLFLHTDDVLYANENFVTVHASETGKKKIHFKRPCDPYEVYEKKYYGHNVTEIEVDMRFGETLMFCTQPVDEK